MNQQTVCVVVTDQGEYPIPEEVFDVLEREKRIAVSVADSNWRWACAAWAMFAAVCGFAVGLFF